MGLPWIHKRHFYTIPTWYNLKLLYSKWNKKLQNKIRFILFNATFNNTFIVAVSFIGWGNRSIPVVSHWQTQSHNVSSTPRLNRIRTHNVSGDRHCTQVVVNPTTIRSRPRRPPSLQNRRMNQIFRFWVYLIKGYPETGPSH